MAEGLRVNRSLWNLRLNNNRIGDEGASALREALRENNTLHYLFLGGNEISDTKESGTAADKESVTA